MCGIVGFINFDSNLGSNKLILDEMSNELSHRGPNDSNKIVIDHSIYLSHLRLSIQDITKNGSQPMSSKSSRFIIAFNGEIYNHLEIRNEINKFKTIKWQSTSDTETLIESFEFYGIDKTLEKLSGMFAISLIDKKNSKLYLIRDRMGEKPIYYGYNESNFYFTSELKSLKKNKKINLEINELALSKFFKYGYIPSPLSIYKNTFKLSPGSYIELDYKIQNFTKYKTVNYWNINSFRSRNKNSNYSSIKDNCEILINNSIQEQLISDVPLGAFLSSGIDSSLIVSIMSKNIKQKIETFSIGFNEENYNEAKNAKKIANYLGTNHNELYVNSNHVIDLLPKISEIYDEPFADSSQIPTFLVSNFAKQKVTVSLSGDGGDELFAGYNRYVNSNRILKFNKLIPNSIKNILKYFLTILTPSQWNKFYLFLNKIYIVPNINLPGDKIYKIIDLIYKNDISNLYDFYISFWKQNEKPFIKESNNKILNNFYHFVSEEDFISEMMIIDSQNYLPDDILVKVDRASMANSLESRAPFLNKNLVEYSQTIDSSFKFNKKNKIILRDILSKYLPKELYDLPKSGFGIPLDVWLREDLKDWVNSLINKKELSSSVFLNQEYISKIFNEHISNTRNWSNKIWTVLMFQSWIKNFEK